MSLALHEILESLYGVRTYPRENAAGSEVGVVAEVIARNNPMRASLLVVNMSANVMYIGLTAAVAATHGMIIAPNGGSILFQWDRDFELVTEEWYCVAAGANSDIYVLENILQ